MPVRTTSKLDAVVITHGHLDHTGRLPLLAKLGYRGPVFATPATQEMATLVLRDSAKIQERETQRENKGGKRAGQPLLEPLYTTQDAKAILGAFQAVPYLE